MLPVAGMRWLPVGVAAMLVLCAFVCKQSEGAYISNFDKIHKDNQIDRLEHVKRYGPAFKNDRDISRYLKIYGIEMMLWRCRNAIQPYWNWKPINFVELYCEAIGRLRRVSWYHNGKEVNTGRDKHYSHKIIPHYANGRYFSRWIDFRLKIYNATTTDSGIYTFKAWSPSGYSEDQMIYVDISEKKKKKKKRKRKQHVDPNRDQRRMLRLHQHHLEAQLRSVRGSHLNMTSSRGDRSRGVRDINKEHVVETE